jgi:hypothetical protein
MHDSRRSASLVQYALIIWLGVVTNNTEYEVLPDLNTCLQRKARLEHYLSQVRSQLKVDCIAKP